MSLQLPYSDSQVLDLLAKANNLPTGISGQVVVIGSTSGTFAAETLSMNFPKSSFSSTSLTASANTTYYKTSTTTSLSLTLGTPASDADSEWRVIVKTGSSFSLTVTPPTGYQIVWDGGSAPTWGANKIYELSFAILYASSTSTVIGAIVKEWL